MIVSFAYRDSDGLLSWEEWDMTNVPRVGEYVHLDKGHRQGAVTAVSWRLNTLERPMQKVEVFIGGAESAASRRSSGE